MRTHRKAPKGCQICGGEDHKCFQHEVLPHPRGKKYFPKGCLRLAQEIIYRNTKEYNKSDDIYQEHQERVEFFKSTKFQIFIDAWRALAKKHDTLTMPPPTEQARKQLLKEEKERVACIDKDIS